MSRISVIISTYRRDESLKTAVASVRAQTYPDVEILIADDNADPAWNGKVARVAAEYGARHIVNEQNLGSARNRNHAASLATGEYLAFLDDDDRYLPDKLARQYECIREKGADHVHRGSDACKRGRPLHRNPLAPLSDKREAAGLYEAACALPHDQPGYADVPEKLF